MNDDQTYRVRTLAGYWKLIVAAWSAVTAVAAVCCILSPARDWLTITIIMLPTFGTGLLIAWLSVQPRYLIRADRIQWSIFGICYRTILLSDYPVIIVTNASFHTKTSGLYTGAMPLIDKEKSKALGCPVCFPYFVAATQDYPAEMIRSGMNAADVYAGNWYHAVPIGLCCPSALERLRTYIEPLVQADVREHYPGWFSAEQTKSERSR